ncbi:hypothetical protein FA95DRAFT_1286383 [Auriscalpium vulgare]|uniref:Uncharacterized protein n=1 Tax=Auriscalpium vulgare TaxID=40419 RepID=A0ACB8RRW4_9AGAM|nr:hypothetical protein FA95DRAFT_1286383 [Auriscalpium vulgare]
MWEDGIIERGEWKAFADKVQADWQDINLLATVLLSVNVGFLAIPGVVPLDASSKPSGTSAAQVLGYLSVLFCAGSIVMGLVLIPFNRGTIGSDWKPSFLVSASHFRWDVFQGLTEVIQSKYVSRNDRSSWGLEPMAVVYSLPFVFLLWA